MEMTLGDIIRQLNLIIDVVVTSLISCRIEFWKYYGLPYDRFLLITLQLVYVMDVIALMKNRYRIILISLASIVISGILIRLFASLTLTSILLLIMGIEYRLGSVVLLDRFKVVIYNEKYIRFLEYLEESPHAFFIIPAIGLLIATAILIPYLPQYLTNGLATYAYYQLVTGVFTALIIFYKERGQECRNSVH